MTSKEFAKIIGVSQSTISRAMNNSELVTAERREYIQQKAVEYGFVLNSQARSLKTNRTGTVGILFPKHFMGMHANLGLAYLYDLVQKELRKHGYDIMVVYDSDVAKGLSVFEYTIKKHKVDGFIVLRLDFSREELDLIRKYKVPCVYLLNAVRVDECSSSCISDSEYGGYLVGQYFSQFKDYTCYYINVNETADTKSRLAGYNRGLAEQGVTLKRENILTCNLSIQSAYECIVANQDSFKGRKCAVFAYNDMIALGAVNACKELGLKIPEVVQVVGMDALPLVAELSPKITTVRLFQSEIAEMGCDLLRKAIEDTDKKVVQMIIKPEFVKGATTL